MDSQPQQPGLPAFILYDTVPAGCTLHQVRGNEALPFLQAGDVAIVDPNDTEPMPGELFVRQMMDDRQVVEVRGFDTSRCTKPGGAPFTERMWAMFWIGSARTVHGASTPLRWMDGPCSEAAMARMLIGRVVGVLSAANDGTLRQIGRAA